MLETVKNPEQLELFKVLNQNQQNGVEQYVKSENQRVVDRVSRIKKIIDLLEEAGFEAGVNFERKVKIGTSTHERTFGWGDDKFKADITVNTVDGGLYLIHKSFYGGKLETKSSSISLECDKLMCSSITPQYRYYKPSSLLEKLNEYNNNQQWKFDNYNKKKSLLNYTLDKYTKLFPNADVQTGTGYQGRNTFTTVLVSFKGGSWVELKLGFKQDEEYTLRKFDAKLDVLKGMDLLNHFNEQK